MDLSNLLNPSGSKSSGWSMLAGFGYNLAVDVLKDLIKPGEGADFYERKEAVTKSFMPSIENYAVVSQTSKIVRDFCLLSCQAMARWLMPDKTKLPRKISNIFLVFILFQG